MKTILKFNGATQAGFFDLSGTRKVELTGFTLEGDHSPNAHRGIFGQGGGGHWIHHLMGTNNTVVGNGMNNELASHGFANRKPVADFICPTNVVVGQIAVFTNTSSDSDGRIGHVLWDFGEGVPSSQFNDTHVYGRPGIFRVTLVVWDNRRRDAIKERLVTVKPAPQ